MAKMKSRCLGLLIFMAGVVAAAPAFSCGPFFIEAGFTNYATEDMIRGNVGVIHSSYRSYYLVPAYRYLTGLGMSSEEQLAMLSKGAGEKADGENWFNKWAELRNNILKTARPLAAVSHFSEGIDRYEVKAGRYSYLNCHADAFRSAVETLNDRIRRFGRDSAEVAEWTWGQDTVFSNCSKGHNIPGPVDEGMNALIKYDRAYQLAAAHFYAGDFVEAAGLFGAISEDEASPWSGVSRYLQARALIRQATVNAPEGQSVDIRVMNEAEVVLQSILKSKELAQYHAPARKLLGYARAVSKPAEYIHDLALALAGRNPGRDIFRYWREFSFMLIKADSKLREAARSNDDITDWILTVQESGDQALVHAVKKWKETSSAAWLVVAMMKITPESPDAPALIAAANGIGPDSPAYRSVKYHLIRLMIESGKYAEARETLDGPAAGRGAVSPADENLFSELRFRMSRNMAEFVRYAQRTPTCIGDNMDGCRADWKRTDLSKYEGRKYLDMDAATVINEYLPLHMMKTLAENRALAADIRRELASAVFVRAVILGNDRMLNETVPLLSGFYPESKGLLSELAGSKQAEKRRFLAAYMVLQYPGMKPFVTSNIGRDLPDNKIDSFRRNWWCSLKKGRIPADYSRVDSEEGSGIKNSRKRQALYPLFLTKDDIGQTEREMKTLRQTAGGPDYLTDIIVKWAGRKTAEPYLPHALHLAVKSTRYGCVDKDTSGYSKQAFRLLHGKYPGNKWTKQTPYFY
jgi:hypothetical protein